MRNVLLSTVLLFGLFIPFIASAQHITVLQQGNPISIRGLSVVNNKVAWVSGSKGHIAITTDGGATWNWQQVKGFEKADFRDIEAFSATEAIIMSSGTPALIMRTKDGGVHWQVKYKNADSVYFLDAMEFTDKLHGYVLGDPINNKFLLLETKDGGETWTPFANTPDAFTNEAAFAASGTCLRVNNNNIVIATGGSHARILTYNNNNWQYTPLPLTQGKASEGAFSVAIHHQQWLAVGGDYSNDKRRDSTACYATNNGTTWQLSSTQPAGFQSGVEHIGPNTYLATGTSGSNITTDGGKTWTNIDSTSYNVCRVAKHGKLVLLAGDGGKIGILKF